MHCIKILEIIAKEFITITEHLAENYDIENNRIIIERNDFKELLQKYDYMNFKQKCKIYKQLNFIIHDKNNYTLPVRTNTKTERKVVINFETYAILKTLIDITVN